MKYSIPKQVDLVLKMLRGIGFEAYPVGGCVRDLLLGRTPVDWDITTNALPQEVKATFADERVVETGIAHGTVTVIIEGCPVEITTFRGEGGYSDGRHPDSVTFASQLADDLCRRDFTINALCLGENGSIIDMYGGQADLNAKILRAIGDPEIRFREDYLRILRAVRFSAQLGFTIEPATAQAMEGQKSGLQSLSAERIFSELSKLICAPHCQSALLLFPQILFEIIPELKGGYKLYQRQDYHCYDVYEHVVRATCAIEPSLHLRLAMLLHDIGKPACADGNGHFKGHAAAGTAIAEKILRRLGCQRGLQKRVVRLVRLHDLKIPPDRGEVRRLLAKYGEATAEDLIKIWRADNSAKRTEIVAIRLRKYDQVEVLLREILAERTDFTLKGLEVNGRDMLELGLAPGPEIGRVLGILRQEVTDERLLNRREELLNRAKAIKVLNFLDNSGK